MSESAPKCRKADECYAGALAVKEHPCCSCLHLLFHDAFAPAPAEPAPHTPEELYTVIHAHTLPLLEAMVRHALLTENRVPLGGIAVIGEPGGAPKGFYQAMVAK